MPNIYCANKSCPGPDIGEYVYGWPIDKPRKFFCELCFFAIKTQAENNTLRAKDNHLFKNHPKPHETL